MAEPTAGFVETIVAPRDRRLAPFVKCLWSFRSEAPAALPGVVVPDAHAEFVIHLGRPWEMAAGAGTPSPQPRAFLLGQSRGSLRFAAGGPSDLVAFRTSAVAATALVGRRMAELWDEPVPLEELWGGRARALFAALSVAGAPAERFAILESFLSGALVHVDSETSRAAALLDELMRRAPEQELHRLGARFGTGLRTMERRFAERVGISPQRVHLIARFLHGCRLLRTARELDIGAIARGAGFYDHAHFSNRFRELAGLTPSRFRALADVHYVELAP